MKRLLYSKGFLLADVLLTIMIVSSLVPITISGIRILTESVSFPERVQDGIALAQLRNYLQCSDIVRVEADKITFIKEDQERYLFEGKGKLIVGNGVLIFLNEVSNVSFYETDAMIYMHYERGMHAYEAILTYR